ncbi:MAG: hypothetical protein MJ252_15485 [archaeon]|nr:hypothetical protein [archaeon]
MDVYNFNKEYESLFYGIKKGVNTMNKFTAFIKTINSYSSKYVLNTRMALENLTLDYFKEQSQNSFSSFFVDFFRSFNRHLTLMENLNNKMVTELISPLEEFCGRIHTQNFSALNEIKNIFNEVSNQKRKCDGVKNNYIAASKAVEEDTNSNGGTTDIQNSIKLRTVQEETFQRYKMELQQTNKLNQIDNMKYFPLFEKLKTLEESRTTILSIYLEKLSQYLPIQVNSMSLLFNDFQKNLKLIHTERDMKAFLETYNFSYRKGLRIPQEDLVTYDTYLRNLEEMKQRNRFRTDRSEFHATNDSFYLKNDFDIKSHNLDTSLGYRSLDEYVDYDEVVLPAVANKMVKSKSKENVIEDSYNIAEPEPLNEMLKIKYELLLKFLSEEVVCKIFSKQILWKEDGLCTLIAKMPEMFSKAGESLNDLITLLMKLVMQLMDVKHPSIIVKAIEILKCLFGCIKNNKTKLHIDLTVTDRLLKLLKQKLGDSNNKIRKKSVELYTFMLTLNFCDYNNLISELVEEELKHLDSNFVQRNIQIILGKMEIFDNVFDNFNDAISNKRTTMDNFPVNLVSSYLILYIPHSKSEVRKKARACLKKFISIFGVKKVVKKLERIDQRELIKLVAAIPELKEYVDLSHIEQNSSMTLGSGNLSFDAKKGNSKPKTKSPAKTTAKSKCYLCLKELNSKEEFAEHCYSECPMFIQCDKCDCNIEIKKLIHHRLAECKFKEDFVECKRCKEAIPKNEYDSHVKENNCNPAKNINIRNRCPLCHKDIPVGDKGFYTHLVKEGCENQKRK